MILKFNKINKYFDKFHVLQDIDFEVKSGQIFGYLGRNGAGKTTSLRILMNVFECDNGSITMDGKSFKRDMYSIGYLPEERGMYSKSLVKDQLVYFSMLRGASKKDAQVTVEKWAKKFEIEKYLNKKLETLSKGNQQKVQITQAFLNEPDILILDEPFSGLDPVNSQVFQDALKEYISQDKIIIFSSHQMGYVETFCDDIAIIDQGKIVLNGSLNEIKKGLGKNKILLNVSGLDQETLVTKLTDLVVESEVREHDFIMTLKEGTTKNEVLKQLIAQDITINKIDDYQPSLHEIFINQVGDKL